MTPPTTLAPTTRPATAPFAVPALLVAALAVAGCGGGRGATAAAAPLPATDAALVDRVEALQAAACACTEPACHEAQATALRGVLAEVPAEATLGDAGAVRYGRAVLGAVQCIYAMTDDERAAIGELAAMRDKVCACRDHNCVAVMEDGLDRFGDDFDARLHSTGSLRREGELSRELMDCLSNLDDGDWDDGDGDGPDGFSEGGEGWPEGEENGDPGDD